MGTPDVGARDDAIFKICTRDEWEACVRDGALPWSAADRRDGFVHLSARDQVQETAARHFRGRADLRLLWVDPAALPEGALRWERSRGGAEFPHLHADLPRAAVVHVSPLDLGEDGIPEVEATISGV